MEINWEVDHRPTLPRIRSPRKNSMTNLPALYNVRYIPRTNPSVLNRFAINISMKKCRKFNPLDSSCVGIKGTLFGAYADVLNVMPIQLSVSNP